MSAGSGTGTTCRREAVWSAAVVNRPWRARWASGGSETQQNQTVLGWRASGVSMLTSPPDAVRVTQRPCLQTKSRGPRLATMTMPGSAPAGDGLERGERLMVSGPPYRRPLVCGPVASSSGRLLAFKVKQLTSFVEAIGSRAGSGLPILADQATGRSFRALPPPSWPPIHPPGATDDSTDRAATLRL